MKENELYKLVGYLANPNRKTNIEVEMPERRQINFIKEYDLWTNGFPLPLDSSKAPYYVWSNDVNKYGLEIRLYFTSNDNMPDSLSEMLEPRRIQNRPGYDNWLRRISTKDNIIPFLKNGFILGDSQDLQRIKSCVPPEYVKDFDIGYSL